jgi:predicted transcriptional regulator
MPRESRESRRQPATSFRLGPDTEARIAELARLLGASATQVVREAVRRLHRAETAACQRAETAGGKP